MCAEMKLIQKILIFCVNIYKHMTWKTVYYIDDKYIRFVQFAPIISCCFHKSLILHLYDLLKVYNLNYDASHFKWNHRKKRIFFRSRSVYFINKISSRYDIVYSAKLFPKKSFSFSHFLKFSSYNNTLD